MLSKFVKLFITTLLTVGVSASVLACPEGHDDPNCQCPSHGKKDQPAK